MWLTAEEAQMEASMSHRPGSVTALHPPIVAVIVTASSRVQFVLGQGNTERERTMLVMTLDGPEGCRQMKSTYLWAMACLNRSAAPDGPARPAVAMLAKRESIEGLG